MDRVRSCAVHNWVNGTWESWEEESTRDILRDPVEFATVA